jgi:mannose-6-phosphate isomerase-like protein (cupin superfamily)
MRALMKVGLSLLLLAFLLIGLSYGMLRAQGISRPSNPEGRMLASETRSLAKGIVAVDLNGPIDMTLRQGAVPSLVVRGEQRLLGNVETTVDGATLHIGTTGMLLFHRQPLQVVLVLPEIENLSVQGSGDSTVNGFSGDSMEIQLRGAGSVKFNGRYKDITASVQGSGDLELNGGSSDLVTAELVGSGQMTVVGAATRFKVEQTGSGDLNAQHLAADHAEVELHGSGTSIVKARKAAAVTVRGSGDVIVYGNPNQREVNRTGSGDVTFKQ